MRQLLLGGDHEQKADKSMRQTVRESADRMLGKAVGRGAGGMSGVGSIQGNIGLFAAMDAPLNGLTPDDILYANEVDAALARRPKFGIRMLSISVAVFFFMPDHMGRHSRCGRSDPCRRFCGGFAAYPDHPES